MPIKLACFDLDGTLLNGRLNWSLEKAGLNGQSVDSATLDEHLERIGGIKNPMALQKTLRDLLRKDVKVAITSFSNHPEAITHVLARIGLTSDEIGKIANFSFRPDTREVMKAEGKNNQLAKAIETYGLQPSDVVLVDDSMNNYELAKQKGYNVIWVQGSEGKVDYLNELREMAGLATPERAAAPVQPPAPAPQQPQGFVAKLLSAIGFIPSRGAAIG